MPYWPVPGTILTRMVLGGDLFRRKSENAIRSMKQLRQKRSRFCQFESDPNWHHEASAWLVAHAPAEATFLGNK